MTLLPHHADLSVTLVEAADRLGASEPPPPVRTVPGVSRRPFLTTSPSTCAGNVAAG